MFKIIKYLKVRVRVHKILTLIGAIHLDQGGAIFPIIKRMLTLEK